MRRSGSSNATAGKPGNVVKSFRPRERGDNVRKRVGQCGSANQRGRRIAPESVEVWVGRKTGNARFVHARGAIENLQIPINGIPNIQAGKGVGKVRRVRTCSQINRGHVQILPTVVVLVVEQNNTVYPGGNALSFGVTSTQYDAFVYKVPRSNGLTTARNVELKGRSLQFAGCCFHFDVVHKPTGRVSLALGGTVFQDESDFALGKTVARSSRTSAQQTTQVKRLLHPPRRQRRRSSTGQSQSPPVVSGGGIWVGNLVEIRTGGVEVGGWALVVRCSQSRPSGSVVVGDHDVGLLSVVNLTNLVKGHANKHVAQGGKRIGFKNDRIKRYHFGVVRFSRTHEQRRGVVPVRHGGAGRGVERSDTVGTRRCVKSFAKFYADQG